MAMILDTVPDIRKHIGARFVALYRSKGLSQKALCNASGLSAPTIRAIENGDNLPRYSNLETLAECLGVDVSYFFEGIESDDPVLAEINAFLRGASEYDRAMILGAVRGLKGIPARRPKS